MQLPQLLLLALTATASFAADPNAPVNPADYAAPVRIACLGDSITHGVGAETGWAWPDQLDRMLGEKFDVRNFGHSGATVGKADKHTIWNQKEYKDALALQADVVVIMLGSNDSKPDNWAQKDKFASLYRQLVGSFTKLSSHPRIFVCTPPFVAKKGAFGINDPVVREQIVILRDLAKEEGLGFIDVHAATDNQDALFKDTVHPTTAGATVIAKAIYRALAGQEWTGLIPSPQDVKKDKTSAVQIANAGDLTYWETFALIMLDTKAPSEKLNPVRAKFESTVFELQQKVASLERQIEEGEKLRMKFKYADPKQAGEHKAKVGQLRKELDKLQRDSIEDLIALMPEESKPAFGTAWLNKYVLERLAPVNPALTPAQKQKIKEICAAKGPDFGRINNTPERTVERIEVYKQVYASVLEAEQKKRVEPK